MGIIVKKYEDWLALSDSERSDVKLSWNAYERESIGVPYTAAGRLAMVSERKILDLSIGTYPGGEYLIHATVSVEEFAKFPAMLSDEFEGFRIVWLAEATQCSNAESAKP
ncbi:MAG: hypothetical protein ACSHYB_13530 [Roseibacillus sp.]